MKPFAIFIFLPFLFQACFAQDWQAEVMAGTAGYSGDLSGSDYSFRHVRPALALNGKWLFNDRLALRGGFSYGNIGASDKDNPDSNFRRRNLSFRTNVFEFSFAVECNLLSPDLFDIYPYVFLGAGFFHFNPYSTDNENNRVWLRPLSTEGEGLPEYPGRKPYSLNQFCIPFGGGIKKTLDARFTAALEMGFRKIFTDYLDDVSATYISEAVLLREKGQKAVEMAFRDLRGPQPAGHARGNSGKVDWYYFTGLKLTYTLGKSSLSLPE